MEAISKVLFGKEGMQGLQHQPKKESDAPSTINQETQVPFQEQPQEPFQEQPQEPFQEQPQGPFQKQPQEPSLAEEMKEAMIAKSNEGEQQESAPSAMASQAKDKWEQFMPSSGDISSEEKQESSGVQDQFTELSQEKEPKTSATVGAPEPATTSVPPSFRETNLEEQHHKIRISYPLKDLPGSLPTAVSLLSDIDDWQSPMDMTKADEEFFAEIDVPAEVADKKKVTYKFLCDGQWTTNPLLATEADDKGNVNHVLQV